MTQEVVVNPYTVSASAEVLGSKPVGPYITSHKFPLASSHDRTIVSERLLMAVKLVGLAQSGVKSMKMSSIKILE